MTTPPLNQALKDFPALQDIHVALHLSGPEAWVIMGQLQLALRHPENTKSAALIAKHITLKLQKVLSVTPALQAIAEMGWHPEHDL